MWCVRTDAAFSFNMRFVNIFENEWNALVLLNGINQKTGRWGTLCLMSLDFREPPCWACRIQSSLKSASNLSSSLGVAAVSTLPSGQTFPYHTYCILTYSMYHTQPTSWHFTSPPFVTKVTRRIKLMSLNQYMIILQGFLFPKTSYQLTLTLSTFRNFLSLFITTKSQFS